MLTPDHELADYVTVRKEGPYVLHRGDLAAALAGGRGLHKVRSIDGWVLDTFKLESGELAMARAMYNAEGICKMLVEDPWILVPQGPAGTTSGPSCAAPGQLGQVGGGGNER